MLAAALLLCAGTVARAQSLPNPFGTAVPVATPAPLYASAPVALDGTVLFSLAVPVNASVQRSAAMRAADVGEVLQSIVAVSGSGGHAQTAYDPATLRVRIERHGDDPVLSVVDADHRDPLPIVTVTSADAAAQRADAESLAGQWQATLQGALEHALTIRQPDVQRSNARVAVALGIALAILSVAVVVVLRSIGRRIDALAGVKMQHERDLQDEQALPSARGERDSDERRQRVVALVLRTFAPERQLQLLGAVRGLLGWGLVLAWFAAGTWILLLFPATLAIGHRVLRGGFAIGAIWLIAAVLDRALSIAIGRLPSVWALQAMGSHEDRARQMLRGPTIVRAIDGAKSVALAFIAILATLPHLGISVASVVTIGGLAAIGVSLAAQNLIRDFLGGFLVLAEDQYVVGDSVTIFANGANNVGTVEGLTLRIVQLRDESGSLITIAHSAATSVTNHSRTLPPA